jgi:hypothetical protein
MVSINHNNNSNDDTLPGDLCHLLGRPGGRFPFAAADDAHPSNPILSSSHILFQSNPVAFVGAAAVVGGSVVHDKGRGRLVAHGQGAIPNGHGPSGGWHVLTI